MKTYDKDELAFEQARIFSNLGSAYLGLSQENDSIDKAINYLNKALKVITRESDAMSWAIIKLNIGSAYLILSGGKNISLINKALNCYNHALQVIKYENNPINYGIIMKNLCQICSTFCKCDENNINLAIKYCSEAIRVYTIAYDSDAYGDINKQLAYLYGMLYIKKRSINFLIIADSYLMEANKTYLKEIEKLKYRLKMNKIARYYYSFKKELFPFYPYSDLIYVTFIRIYAMYLSFL